MNLLDEIGDISPTTQAKLLRVLQEREIERVGSHQAIKCDVRVDRGYQPEPGGDDGDGALPFGFVLPPAALDEVVMALKVALRRDSGVKSQQLFQLSELVARCAVRPLHDSKPVVGAAAFRHESGIHCAALIVDEHAYEPFPPAAVGSTRPQFVIGRHSGTRSLQAVLGSSHPSLSRSQADRLLDKVRRLATEARAPLPRTELAAHAASLLNENL